MYRFENIMSQYKYEMIGHFTNEIESFVNLNKDT